MPRSVPSGSLLVATAIALVVSLTPRPAAADEDDIFTGLGIGVLVVDLGFVVRDISLFALDRRESIAAIDIAESIWMTPQAIGVNGALAGLMADDGDEEIFAALHLPAMITAASSAHGIWSLAAPETARSTRFLASTAFGVNLSMSSAAVSMYFTDDLDEHELIGLYMTGLSIPNGTLSYYLASQDEGWRTMWLSQGIWSSMLAVHGVATALGAFEDVDLTDMARLDLGPANLGSPVEGAPQTPGVVFSGAF